MTPQPNKNKPPLQVLAVAEGNSEKIKVWGEARDDIIINHIKPIYSYKTLRFSHFLSASGLESAVVLNYSRHF